MDTRAIIRINSLTVALWAVCLLHGFLWTDPLHFLAGQATVLALTALLLREFRPLLWALQRITGVRAAQPFWAMLAVSIAAPAGFLVGWGLGADPLWVERGKTALAAAYMFAGFWMALTVIRLADLVAARAQRWLPRVLVFVTGISLFAGPGLVYARLFANEDIATFAAATGPLPFIGTFFFGVCFLYAQASLRRP